MLLATRRGIRLRGRDDLEQYGAFEDDANGDTRSMEIRATLSNAFNTVQYSGVGTVEDQPRFGR